MPLPLLLRQLVDKKLSAYCARKIPPHARDKLRLDYKIRGNSVTLYEERPFLPQPRRMDGALHRPVPLR